eukprot:3115419-Prymnesium_polylepis.3
MRSTSTLGVAGHFRSRPGESCVGSLSLATMSARKERAARKPKKHPFVPQNMSASSLHQRVRVHNRVE